eukprot:6611457-Prymnesium_polylepis.1
MADGGGSALTCLVYLTRHSLSMYLGHAPRCGRVCPHTLAPTATHGARHHAPGPERRPEDGGA